MIYLLFTYLTHRGRVTYTCIIGNDDDKDNFDACSYVNQLNRKEEISMIFLKFKSFYLRKFIWKCLQRGGILVSTTLRPEEGGNFECLILDPGYSNVLLNSLSYAKHSLCTGCSVVYLLRNLIREAS